MTIIVGAYEAKTNFSALLDRVAQGEIVTVSRHGTPVAQLIPLDKPKEVQAAQAAARIKRMREGIRLQGLDLRELMNEGRR